MMSKLRCQSEKHSSNAAPHQRCLTKGTWSKRHASKIQTWNQLAPKYTRYTHQNSNSCHSWTQPQRMFRLGIRTTDQRPSLPSRPQIRAGLCSTIQRNTAHKTGIRNAGCQPCMYSKRNELSKLSGHSDIVRVGLIPTLGQLNYLTFHCEHLRNTSTYIRSLLLTQSNKRQKEYAQKSRRAVLCRHTQSYVVVMLDVVADFLLHWGVASSKELVWSCMILCMARGRGSQESRCERLSCDYTWPKVLTAQCG